MRTVENEIANKMSSVDTADASEYFFYLLLSELPSQNMQILQKYSKKCQIFAVLRIRPQGQRPNSKTFKW